MHSHFHALAQLAVFDGERYAKRDLSAGRQLFTGLNCFEPGQGQALHTHTDADKCYLIVSGRARLRVGDEAADAGPGTLVWAPAGVPHGVEEALERTVMLVVMAPPPPPRRPL